MAGAEGTTFGRYFLLKKLAAGGMGEIYLAKLKGPVGFEKLLVVKRILEQYVENEEFLDMFFSEARVAAQLTHSNVVQIYEMGRIEDAYFIAMEYVHGKGLRDIIDRARDLGDFVPPAHAIEITSKLCAGLSYAHNAADMMGNALGIIHRDINPHNVLVSYAGDVKVIDFGIAKSEIQSNKTQAGTIKGKFVYMSPEQSAAEPLDKRSDIFAVGICLNELLTGINPFAKANVILSLDAIQRGTPDSPSQTNVRLAPFDAISAKALAKNREERYADCHELRDDLQELLTSGQIPKPPQTLAEYMHDLFSDQIIKEKRMIIETDTASTNDLEQMREAAVRENTAQDDLLDEFVAARVGADADDSSNSTAPTTPMIDFDEDEDATGEHEPVAAHAAARVEVVEEKPRRARWPFVLAFFLLLGGTGGAGVWILAGQQTRAEPIEMATIRPEPATPPNTPPTTPPPVTPPATPVEGGEAGSTTPPEETGKVAPPKNVQRPKRPRTPKKPKKAEEAVPKGHGTIMVSTSPPLEVTHNGNKGQTVKLEGGAGTIFLGRASDGTKLFVKINYKIKKNRMAIQEVSVLPWAIVSKDGLSLGKSPIKSGLGLGKKISLELANPKVKKHRISLRFLPP